MSRSGVAGPGEVLGAGAEPVPGEEAGGAPGGAGLLARVQPYLPSVGGWRRTTRGQVALARARAAADRGLLIAFAVLVVLATGLAVAVPRQMARTVDDGARAAVRQAGTAAAADVRYVARYQEPERDFFDPSAPPQPGDPETAEEIRTAAADTVRATPRELARILAPMTVAGLSNTLTVTALVDPDADKPRPTVAMIAHVGWADPRTGGGVRWVQGAAPTSPTVTALHRPTVPVGVSEAAAQAWGLMPGARLTGKSERGGWTTLLVTGVFTAEDPTAAVWRSLPSALTPVPTDVARNGTLFDDVTFLVDESALPVAESALGDPGLTTRLRREVDLQALTGSGLQAALPTLLAYASDAADPLPSDPSADFVSTLPQVAQTYAVRARAVVAQLSMAVVSLVGVAGVTLLLAAQLLISRRRQDLALGHARGASLTATAAGLLLESAAVVVPSALLGVVLGVLATPGGDTSPGIVVLVVVLAVLLAPVLGAAAARSAWASRKTPANRRARARQAAERAGRRVVGELVVLAAAAGAVLAVRSRGLVGVGDGVDPLLAASPLLLTGAVTVVVLRLYPLPVRLARAVAARRPGPMGLVASARAGSALSWSPLLALTLAVGLMVGTGLVRTTLVEGQDRASWQRVGADVRVSLRDTPLRPGQLEALRQAPGVDLACTGATLDARAAIGSSRESLKALVVDAACFSRLLGTVRAATEGPDAAASPAADVAGLATASVRTAQGGEALPVLLSGADWPADGADLVLGDVSVSAVATGHVSVPVTGWLPGPALIVDEGRARDYGLVPPATLALLTGPGALTAVQRQPQLAGWDVVDRRGWLSELASGGVIHDVGVLLVVAVVLLGLLAGIAMVQTVAAGAAQRGRAVSLLRTLGLTMREGRLLTLAELLPLMATGVVAGAAAGFALVAVLGPSLGLEVVTGGVDVPPLRLAPGWAAGVAAAALVVVVLAAVVESLLQRGQRLASVLRVGDVGDWARR
ncbi:MAG: FtsX-like permease family protein [Kineosporiaceae bacterium]